LKGYESIYFLFLLLVLALTHAAWALCMKWRAEVWIWDASPSARPKDKLETMSVPLPYGYGMVFWRNGFLNFARLQMCEPLKLTLPCMKSHSLEVCQKASGQPSHSIPLILYLSKKPPFPQLFKHTAKFRSRANASNLHNFFSIQWRL